MKFGLLLASAQECIARLRGDIGCGSAGSPQKFVFPYTMPVVILRNSNAVLFDTKQIAFKIINSD